MGDAVSLFGWVVLASRDAAVRVVVRRLFAQRKNTGAALAACPQYKSAFKSARWTGVALKDNEDVAHMEDTEDTEVVCPYCGLRNIAGIMYGMPVFDAGLRRKLDEGTVALGGCEIGFDRPMPTHHCNDCGEEF
ncbi:hypothetical protein [Bifidobacterium pseudolongum]|uniref:hypothetical protein n=1 Tax=Bifidobacterium pseudolongum TaxID=1694 RepID=UPI001F0DFA9B|nr:hypothetical protein [Bifidobacterium pseudolongum]